MRVPHYAFKLLRKMNLLEKRRAKLRSIIYSLLDNNAFTLAEGIGKLLSVDRSKWKIIGPGLVDCSCYGCKRKKLYAEQENLNPELPT